jgi:hypothetical protein
MITTAELEAAVLAGKKVTPEQFAQAKQLEEAAARIALLEQQKREKDDYDARYKAMQGRFDELDKTVDATAETFNIPKHIDDLRQVVRLIRQESERQDAFINTTAQTITQYRKEVPGPDGKTQIGGKGAGDMSLLTSPSGKQLELRSAVWAEEVRRAVADVIAELT